MCCFLIVSTIPEHKISWNNQEILLVAAIFFGFIHFIFEIRQFIHRPIAYIASPWNWFDLAAILVPTITSFIWLHYKTPSVWIITIATFLLEIKFLLFFRVLDYFGKYFAIMIGVAQKVFSFLVVLGIIVLAFAHSLHLLLRPTSEYSYNQPSFTNDANNPWNLVPTYKFISSNDTIKESTFLKYLMIIQISLQCDSSSVSSWALKNNWTLAFLLVIFSFFTTIYLLNLFISLLGNAIDDRNNKESFLQSFLQLRGEASVKELKKYIESFEDKENLHPKILEISGIKDSEQKLESQINKVFENKLFQNQINEILKNQVDEILTNKINEPLKNQVNEIFKDLKNEINKLNKLIKEKESD
ncbi:nudt9 protein [Gigaspora margarita]|uniref:Nudt9 protein n=1 Tax=Gigaspora margarita TaxID=4874 RepID=A0A8H4A5F5_GIGMA|nr:nudt9 protein [Gigaspora margarita]